jgi:hypothetical protein
MKNKEKKSSLIEYSSKQELIQMIVRLFDSAPTYVAKQNIMEFLISNYRGVNLSSLKALQEMPYDELEEIYAAIKFVSNN